LTFFKYFYFLCIYFSINFSDSKKKKFKDLALFYESFGALLEKSSKFEEAYEMIQKGIARNALPINRLKKSFEQMKSRIPILGFISSFQFFFLFLFF